MSRRRLALRIGLAVLVLAAISWLVVRTIWSSRPYDFASTDLAGWRVMKGEPGNPAIVVAQPRAALPQALFDQLVRRSGQALAKPERPSIPLVLQGEYEDSLQGVLSVDDLVRIARDAGMETARFEPVCVGRQNDLYFVLFETPAFDEFRQEIAPIFPEHAGNGTYDPGSLRPILTIAAADRELAGRWPTVVDERTDCQAPLREN